MAESEKDEFNGMNSMDSIYDRYSLPLKKYIFSLCRNDALADDIVSETFYKAIKNIDSFDGRNIFTWLCTIAKNSLYNDRKRKDNQNISLDSDELTVLVDKSDVENEVLTKSRNLELYKMMQSLDTAEREVVYLRVFAELSFKEIGEILDKSENWSRVTYFRCREKMRRRMTDGE